MNQKVKSPNNKKNLAERENDIEIAEFIGYRGIYYEDLYGDYVGTINDRPNIIPRFKDSIHSATKLKEYLWNEHIIYSYSSMDKGVRGHFVTLGYLKSSFNSYHNYLSASGETEAEAIVNSFNQYMKVA